MRRREHHPDAGEHGVEGTGVIGQVFGVGLFPGELDTRGGGIAAAGLEEFGGEVTRDDLGAGNAAISSTRCPGPIPQAATSLLPSPGITSAATRG
jgi:hypothetical protein